MYEKQIMPTHRGLSAYPATKQCRADSESNLKQNNFIMIKQQTIRILLLLNFFLLAASVEAQSNSIPLPTVNPGSQPQAEAYYKGLSLDLQFLNTNTILNSKLDDALQYLGYKGLHAVDFDKLPSDVLMDFNLLKSWATDPVGFNAQFHTSNDLPKGKILSACFFAPKITDDSHLPPHAYGWRKLVRLIPNPDQAASGATNKLILEAFVLFNYFQPDLTKSPFDPTNVAVNIQVALVCVPGPIGSNRDPLYWLDYADPLHGYPINFELDAFFDARDPILPKKKYFVPAACAACHNNINKPLLNFLDTDYWIDRALSADFSTFNASSLPILFDAGTRDETTPEYKAAFATIKQINTEIRDQNTNTVRAAFQSAAAMNWVNLHATSVSHVLPIDRAIPTPPATQTWVKGNPDDESILPLLSQYCYRCHGSVSFNIFDKGAVLGNAFKMKTRIEFDYNAHPADRRVAMPPDREMPASDKTNILNFLNKTLQHP